jgi:hypothetical protein
MSTEQESLKWDSITDSKYMGILKAVTTRKSTTSQKM